MPSTAAALARRLRPPSHLALWTRSIAGGGACPDAFLSSLFASAAAVRPRIAFTEPHDGRIIRAAAQVAARGLARPVLVGGRAAIARSAAAASTSLGALLDAGVHILDPDADGGRAGRYAADLAAARAHRGVTPAAAAAAVAGDVHTFAALAVRAGDVDGVVSGATSASRDVLRPALALLARPPPPGAARRLVSSVFFMCMTGGVRVFSDCAVVVAPDAGELATIALDAAATAAAFGVGARDGVRVALLSYATHGSGVGAGVGMVAAAAKGAAARAPRGVFVDGPLQYDAALSPEVATTKLGADVGEVAGRANVLVFPDLAAGNIAYKAVQRASGCLAVGPVVQGLLSPVNDLSRGASVEDIVATAAVTAVQVGQARRERERAAAG